MYVHRLVVCQQKSPVPSFVKGVEIVAAGVHSTAARAVKGTAKYAVNKTAIRVMSDKKGCDFKIFSLNQKTVDG
jgi:hypothetical protein